VRLLQQTTLESVSSSQGPSPSALPLLRCNILESTTGVCLFDKLWDWAEEKSAPGDVSKLILAFVQISGQLGDTDIVHQVLFTEPQQNIGRNLTRRRPKQKAASQIRLALKKGDGIIVGIFHRQPKIRTSRKEFYTLVDAFIDLIRTAFVEKYEKEYSKMGDVFRDIAHQKNKQPLTQADVLKKFIGFGIPLTNIRNEHFKSDNGMDSNGKASPRLLEINTSSGSANV